LSSPVPQSDEYGRLWRQRHVSCVNERYRYAPTLTKRPVRTINQVAFSGLLLNQKRTPYLVSGITLGDKHGSLVPARIRSRTLLCDGPCYGGVSHAPLLGDRPGTLALGDALASDSTLQLGQLGLATHVQPTPSGSSSAVVGTLHDPLALVLRQSAQECDEPTTDGGSEVQVWLVEHLNFRSRTTTASAPAASRGLDRRALATALRASG
jgi:hypothetical protein